MKMIFLKLFNILLVLLYCDWCLTIRVPVVWNNEESGDYINSAPATFSFQDDQQDTDESKQSEDLTKPNYIYNIDNYAKKPVPLEYFEYPANKPQFAVDVATSFGVKSPDKHYQAYRISPYTGYKKPDLGKHYITTTNDQLSFKPFQRYKKYNNHLHGYEHRAPLVSNYEVFHPYKSEEPALSELYKDPTLLKIRNDIRENKVRLQNYETEAGKPNVNKEDDLKNPDEIDNDKFPIKNEPAEHEIYKPQRRPVYYSYPQKFNRNNYLNRIFKHPLQQNYIKIRPVNYEPLQFHIHRLKQHHAHKYDDEHNEYPQKKPVEQISEPLDGYDIYEKGKEKYQQLRNNIDDSINQAVLESRPVLYENLELQNGGNTENESAQGDDNEEFVPIKSYAQVRRTETTKHLPREAALDEATSFEEIKNAPRLREAVKSTKSQTVYSEEGYEDSAYDHAGEQKHASDHEGHGGYLKQKELSEGKFKTPSFTGNYEDGQGSKYGNNVVHGEKWENDGKATKEQLDNEDSSENEYDESIETDIYKSVPLIDSEDKRVKRNEINDPQKLDQHEVNKREAKFKIPEVNLNNTFLTEEEILKISKQKFQKLSNIEDLNRKYPYYNKGYLNKNSALRYGENLKFIPKKSRGGTEFYDSRSKFNCPEVDVDIDPVPQNVKTGDVNSEKDNNRRKRRNADSEQTTQKPRLEGLGDKIDCFKAKYFGEDPLDSPFFNEGVIINPEPVFVPKSPIFELKFAPNINAQESKSNAVYAIAEKLRDNNNKDIFNLIENLRNGHLQIKNKFSDQVDSLKHMPSTNTSEQQRNSSIEGSDQGNVYSDVIQNIKNNNFNTLRTDNTEKITTNLLSNSSKDADSKINVNYTSYNNKEDITKSPIGFRKRRSTSFIYEPYKVIRDNHANDSKKTTTSANVSPLIKQLQSSKFIDIVPTHSEDRRIKDKLQPIKRNVESKQYKDIRKEDRSKGSPSVNTDIVDINYDRRRGEPRYEIRHSNHRDSYTPVQNKKHMSIEEYKAYMNKTENKKDEAKSDNGRSKDIKQSNQKRPPRPTARPYFDVSKFLPAIDLQTTSASKTIRKVVKPTTPSPNENIKDTQKDYDFNDGEEDYDEYDEDDDDETSVTTTTTTTTTTKPLLRIRKIKRVSTTPLPEEDEEEQEGEEDEDEETSTTQPKLKLVTRFRNEPKENLQEYSKDNRKKSNNPNYTEKTKKSSKSTLVKDSKAYGDGKENDMKDDEVDALIGIHEDMDDYMPDYEKEERRHLNAKQSDETMQDDRSENDTTENSDEEADEINDDEDEDEEQDNEHVEDDDDDHDDDEEGEEEDSENGDKNTSSNDDHVTLNQRSRDDPENVILNSEIKSENKIQPIVITKKIEIHKELPANSSSPNTTQFKQDIVEEETIKKLPQKNQEALDLYKDDELVKDINKLVDVDVFKQDLDIRNSPKHGGNYRDFKQKNTLKKNEDNLPIQSKADTETSQSKNEKLIEEEEEEKVQPRTRNRVVKRIRTRGRTKHSEAEHLNEKEIPQVKATVQRASQQARSAKLEIDETEPNKIDLRRMHGGNLKSDNSLPRRRRIQNARIRKLEIDESQGEKKQKPLHGGNLKALAGSNADNNQNAAFVLNGFARAVPILTTTPAYILDPSKRMYFFVEP